MRTSIILILAALLLLIGCSQNKNNPDCTGTFEATEIELSSPEGGKIIFLTLEEGQRVEQDQILVVLDTVRLDIQRSNLQVNLDGISAQKRQLSNKVELAKIQLAAAEREYNRIKDLFDKESAPKAQMDAQTTNLDLARNTLDGAKIALADLSYQEASLKEQIRLLDQRIKDSVIRSPIKGEIIAKFFEQGETIGPMQKILTVADLNRMKLTVYVPEKDLGKLKLNSNVRVRIDSNPDKDYTGIISWISPKAEFTPKNVQTRDARVELVYAIRVFADNPEGMFKIGMPADVYLDNSKH
jgi:HlyD family secretion protein